MLSPAQSAHVLEVRRLQRAAPPPLTGATLSFESGHICHANNSGSDAKCEIAVFNQRVGLRVVHAGAVHFATANTEAGVMYTGDLRVILNTPIYLAR